MTDRKDDTMDQLVENILQRLKALRPYRRTLELKELIEEAQILLPRNEMDRLLNIYVINEFTYHLLTNPPPLPLVVTQVDTRKPTKHV